MQRQLKIHLRYFLNMHHPSPLCESYHFNKTFIFFIKMLSASRLACFSAKLGFSTIRGFASRADNPQVFMDFSAGGKDVGRIIFEVR